LHSIAAAGNDDVHGISFTPANIDTVIAVTAVTWADEKNLV